MRGQQGSMLVEALIALIVFATGILGVIGALTHQAKLGVDSRYRIEAATAVDDLVARMQTAAPATLAARFSTGGDLFDDWLTNRLRAPGTGLPGADADVDFGTLGGDPRTATIEVRWAPPAEAVRDATGVKVATAVVHRYRTVVAVY